MDKVYSEFEVLDQNIKIEGTEAYRALSCIASCKVTKTVKKRIKKCRGVEVKSKPRVVGMAIEMAVHMPRDIYNEINGKNSDLLKEKINGTGLRNQFKTFSLTQEVLNEDDIPLFKAYPNCILDEAIEENIDNTADEISEVTLKIKAYPDEYGFFEYESFKADLDEQAQKDWLTKFTPSMAVLQEV